jgi:hypothetical protein
MSPDTYQISDFHHGQKFTCYIKYKFCEGRISRQDDGIYLCQNVEVGLDTCDKLGYQYSYVITRDSYTLDFNLNYLYKVSQLILFPVNNNNIPLNQILAQ